MRDLYLSIKWCLQRVVRGYDDRLFWHLAEYVDPMVIAHVKNLRENGCGYPSALTQKKWNKILDTILAGFVEEPEFPFSKAWKKYHKNREKARLLLGVYWDNLWD